MCFTVWSRAEHESGVIFSADYPHLHLSYEMYCKLKHRRAVRIVQLQTEIEVSHKDTMMNVLYYSTLCARYVLQTQTPQSCTHRATAE